MKTETLESLTEQALEAFWQVIVTQYPKATTGDLSPENTIGLDLAAESAIKEWIFNNVESSTNCDDETTALVIENVQLHRNGIGGAPFYVLIFQDPEAGRMVGIVFEQECHVAVFNLDKLAAGNIAFGDNSWRGDYYERRLRNTVNLVQEMEG